MNEPAEVSDPQIEAVMKASGHTFDDVCRFLTELNHIGWTVRPITSFCDGLSQEQQARFGEVARRP